MTACTCEGGGYPTRSGHAMTCPRRAVVNGLIARAELDDAIDRASAYDEREEVSREVRGRRRRLAVDSRYRHVQLRRAGA